MLRQRLRAHSSRAAQLGRVVTVIVALILVWYGLMLTLLALKVSPDSINAVSGYHIAYDFLVGLTPADVTGDTRLILGLSGLAAFLVFGYLARKELPRPYLARSDLRLAEGDRGTIDVEARAIERAAEAAALTEPRVVSATGRYGGDDLSVDVTVGHARELPGLLRAVQRGVHAALEQHGLPPIAVNVTLTGLQRKQRRELS